MIASEVTSLIPFVSAAGSGDLVLGYQELGISVVCHEKIC